MSTLTLAPQLNRSPADLGDTYLKLQLDRQTPAILAMKHTQEVLVGPVGRITPIPNMPTCVLGLLNRRSRVLWAIDLAQILQLQPLDPERRQYNMAIIRVGQVPLGLVVHEVNSVTRFTTDCIQSPSGLVASSLMPYLNGCILQQKEVLLVLNAEAIVHSPMLHRD